MQKPVKQNEAPALAWSKESISRHQIINIRTSLATSAGLFGASSFGKFLLTFEAILSLHTSGPLSTHLVLFEEASQLQQIVYPKRRSTCGNTVERVSLNNVCHVGH
jgi:hypothetical protein